ncbi:juvenile hormone esterase [Halyomorpha halys]|uniref:juvenile hormone esterase n=1 Tax=Halyomorpha halys TaxID=286706 RepID=UPI0006D4D38E|nr:venom carboxylesterase-6-like [Halyomorpha halys]
MTKLIVLLCAVAVGHLVVGQSPYVVTSQGTMRGKVLSSRDGRDYFSFTKIPYAKPPVGERRFMISEKADNWTGILDATQPIPSCFQSGYFRGQGFSGQEDCLYLNVFTPNITGRYPVIFAIYGGAFKAGSAAGLGSGKYFMDEDVVLVIPNYRVGNLGFLSLEDNVIPGNMGLKDQALALEWVHQEISAFGGDPNLITVMGQSSGGASSDLICEAPRTNGLIKGCISQSGVGWSSWAILRPGVARQLALKMAKTVGCNETGDLLKCLQSKPVELVGDIYLLQDNTRILSLVSPVLEPTTAPGAILTSWPTTANHSFPWIAGVCQDDGLLFTGMYESHSMSPEETDKFIKNFNQTIVYELYLENRTDEFETIYQKFFTNGDEPLIAIRKFLTEYMFVQPALKGISKHPGPAYYYNFNFTGESQPGLRNVTGVGHGAEMHYLFESSYRNITAPEDVKLSKLLVKMWVNFARDQTPSSKDMVQWSQFEGQTRYYLDIKNSGNSVLVLTQYQEIIDFWKTIFPDQSSESSMSHSPLLYMPALGIITVNKELFP